MSAHPPASPSSAEVMTELRLQRALLIYVIDTLDSSKRDHTMEVSKLEQYVTTINAAITANAEAVAAQTTVIGAIKALIQGEAAQIAALTQQVKDLIASGGDADSLLPVVAALQAHHDALVSNTEALAAAAVSGTPAAS